MNHSLVEGTHAPIAVRFLGDHYSHARAKFRETLGLLLASLNKAHIKVLHFQLDAKELSRSDWLNLFGAFTAVETVSVSGMAVCPFMDALDPRLPADAEHRRGPPGRRRRVLFPNLRCIKLHLVPFLTAAVDDDVLVSRRVETSVRNRRRVNTQLEEIELRDCRVTQGIVDNLRDAVPRVMWDGVSATLCSMGDYGPYSSNWMPDEEDMYDSDDGWAWDEHDEWNDDVLDPHVPAGFYGDLVAVTDPVDLPDPLELEFDQY
ncbi:hypothetical protein EWM64_g3153 [Hericium alpestre]|uniref:Uncharacterized protein n=1 Tax=Hericium alpestre TaxID=135208 RepID=A0A4Z0A1B2_9AGAM|nr:hypothetical protein EWM64_g3153 [Hericium alpestre]